jgi:glycosyl transferase family 11
MVITRLIGGLGNQLFQYALGRRLAHKHGVPLKLDITGFDTYKLHAYSLSHFNLNASVATPEDLRPFSRSLTGRISRRLQSYRPVRWRRWIVEPHVHFAPEILQAGSYVYLEGHWQSEKYFSDVGALLRDEIRVMTSPRGLDAELARDIQRSCAVAMHVRRGDYMTNSTHGLCSIEYYAEGMRRIRRIEPQAHFFVFSDDPQWAAEALSADAAVTVVGHNGANRNYEDFRLMSMCRHFVIANSTFSWWAAWVATHPAKIVIAPRRWFATGLVDGSDVVPESWVRI